MSIRLGDIAPDFEQDSSEGRIRFHEWLGNSWGVLFSHPADFTPVCTTELGFTAKLKDEFAKRNVKAIALSVDPVDSHIKWIDDINETQNTRVNFPILADADRKVSELYDLIHPNANDTLTVRSLFVIDPNKKVRLTITYPASTGRNFHEILRVIDSLQLTDNHKVATPSQLAGRRRGGDRALAQGRGGDQAALSQGLSGGQAVPAPDAAAQSLRQDPGWAVKSWSALAATRVGTARVGALFLDGAVLLVDLHRSRPAFEKGRGDLQHLVLGGSGLRGAGGPLLAQFPARIGDIDVVVVHA